jgi:uncharacterized protein DUF5681
MTDDQNDGSKGPSTFAATDDQVGYRKPPQTHRFKKGQSGNPKGRPKGDAVIDLATLVKQIGAEPAKTADGKKKVSKLEAVLRAEVSRALQGDSSAARTIFNRALKHGLTKAIVQQSFIEITDLPGEFGEIVRAYHVQKMRI